MLLTVLTTAACGGTDDGPFAPGQPSQPETPGKPGGDDDEPAEPLPGGRGRSLVLYCSRTGNTERVARQIRTVLDCDMLEVEPAVPYEDDYNAMLERAQEEREALLLPLDEYFRACPRFTVQNETQEKRAYNGNAFTARGVADGSYRVYDRAGNFLSLSRAEGGELHAIKNFF